MAGKKVILLITIIILVVLIGGYTLYRFVTLGLHYHRVRHSYSVKESNEKGVFIAEYKIEYINENIFDSLKKCKLDYVNFNKMQYWIERGFYYTTKFFYFDVLKFKENNNLLITNPTDSTYSLKYPYLRFKIKGYQDYKDNGSAQEISVLEIDSIYSPIELELYLEFMYGRDDIYIGNIILKKNSYDILY